jgi:arsenate reductase
MIYPELEQKIQELSAQADEIPVRRKTILRALAGYIRSRAEDKQPINLNFICTHNSRRSQMSQVWAQVAAARYGWKNVQCYSAGTERSRANPQAIEALRHAGFQITALDKSDNPRYSVSWSDDAAPLIVFSKGLSDEPNPSKDFAAIMTCSHADLNCPIVPGASLRIPLNYEDPGAFDGTNEAATKYRETADEIGREILYAFAQNP